MKKACILLMTAAMAAACGGSSNNVNTGANSLVNSMNSNAANMRGANNNSGYVMNSNTTAPPAMPANATNISPPSMGNANHSNSNLKSNTNMNKK